MTSVITRLATIEDVPDIQRLFTQGDAYHAGILPTVFLALPHARPDRIIEACIESPDSDFLLALLDDRVVGFAEVKTGGRPDAPMFIPGRLAVIENMVVDEGHRGRGIGTKLIEEAKFWAEARGLEAMQLTVWSSNGAAIRLYERMGYRPVIQRMELDL